MQGVLSAGCNLIIKIYLSRNSLYIVSISNCKSNSLNSLSLKVGAYKMIFSFSTGFANKILSLT